MDDSGTSCPTDRAPGLRRLPVWWMLSVGLAVIVLVAGLAWQIEGPAPKPPAAAPASYPPLVLADGVPSSSPLAKGARSLSSGDAETARREFTAAVATQPIPARIGLTLTDWGSSRSSTMRRLAALQRQHPRDPYVVLHAGLVRAFAGRAEAARPLLVQARSLAWQQHRFDIARRADDLLHPSFAPGYPVIVETMAQIQPANRARMARVAQLLSAGDRLGAAALAARSDPSGDIPFAVALVAARYDKDDPTRAVRALEALERTAPPSTAALLRVQRALVLMWSGHRSAGVSLLRRELDDRRADASTRQLALAIAHGVA